MIIFLYGPDTYRSRQKLNEIIERYKKIRKSGLNLKYFLEPEMDFQTFLDEMKQTSMFQEKKLAVLVDIFSNPEFKKRFLEKGRDFLKSENIFLFYETNQIPEKDPLFLFLKKFAKVQEFKLLAGQKLKNRVKKEFLNYGIEIKEEALEKLISFVGNDLWQMSNEIKKLVCYRAPRQRGEGKEEIYLFAHRAPRQRGEVKEDKSSFSPFVATRVGGAENEVLFDHKKGVRIELEDVELLVKPKIETDIFQTIDAIAARNKKRALKFIKAHLEKGDSPFYLFSMINFQFRNLLIIKDLIERNLSPYSLSHLHPYVIKKSIPLLEKFSFSELKKIYQKIFQLDLDVKTGKIEPEMALDLLITELPSEAR